MPSIIYSGREIIYTHVINKRLKHGYITVDDREGVILKSPPIDQAKADKFILKKASWIITKLNLVKVNEPDKIVTGSRFYYLGKKYYVNVLHDPESSYTKLNFNHSRFTITSPDSSELQESIHNVYTRFLKEKARDKIIPRIKKWIAITGFKPMDIKLRKMSKRWGSCTRDNTVILNYELIKLPFKLIDYAIVHELVHIKHKEHSKAFWAMVGSFIPDYKNKNQAIGEAK